MTQYGFYFDGTRCTGCRTCVLACKDYYNLSTEIGFRKLIEYGGGEWTQAADGSWTNTNYVYHVSVSCNHCDNPACLAACPQGAISKDEGTGIVMIDVEKCIGCGTCAQACPYGAPKVDEAAKKSVKCTMCAERVGEGKNPICVDACSLRALDFGTIEDLRSKYGTAAEFAPLPAATVTSPNLVVKPPVNAMPSGDTTGSIENMIDIS